MIPVTCKSVKVKERRLAAIMFTDIVGYTALMRSDENKAFDMLDRNRTIHESCIKPYNGTLIKEIGDGTMLSFPLASDAVRCAIDIQNACKKENILLKIGIHEGEVVFEDGDVFGDGVNVASRLESIAKPGCINISEAVHGEIKNKPEFKLSFLDIKALKNIAEPMKVYSVSSEKPEGYVRPTMRPKQSKIVFSKPLLKLSSFIIFLLGVTLIFILFNSSTKLPFKERDWIVISDFENITEDPVFDNSLNTAFKLSVNQSRYLNVVTRQKIKEILKRMKKDQVTHIDEEMAREIAIRENVKIYISPSISKVGNQFTLTAKIQEAQTASILRSEVLYVKSQDEILKKMDQLCKKIRRSLGESRYQIFEQSKPLSKVTTSSLDALKEYSLGIEKHVNLQFKEARTHYENAIDLDSNFTAAKASLGNLLFEKFDKDEGRKWLKLAMVSIDNLTDREKYSILAINAASIDNDLDKSIEYTKTLLNLYPDDEVNHNNLGWYYQSQGQYEKAAEEYKIALGINPYLMLTYGGLNWIYLDYIGQTDSIKVWSQKMIDHAPDNPWGYYYLGSAYAGIDSLQKAENNYIKARTLDQNFLFNLWRLAHVYRLRGSHDKAIEVLKEIMRIDPSQTFANYDIGINYMLKEDHKNAMSKFLELKNICEHWLEAYPKNPNVYISTGLVYTWLGDKEKGWEIGKKAMEIDSTLHIRMAELLAVQDRRSEALDHIETALENKYRNLSWLKLNPNLQSLHNEVRFQQLIEDNFGEK